MQPNSQPEPQPQPPLATPVAYAYGPPLPPRPRSRPLARLLLVLLVLGLCGSLLLNLILLGAVGLASLASVDLSGKVQEKYYSHRPSSSNKVAIISLEGTILSGEGFIKRQIDQAAKDPKVKAVVLRVDSPGGTMTAADYIYYHLHQMAQEKGIPIVVSMGGLAASGGYYVSMACGDNPDVIFAEPTTWTGSIGVIIPHYDLSKLLANWGIEQDSITSRPLKGMGSFTKPMTEEERKILKGLVEQAFERFKDIVKQGRPAFQKDPQALDELATGQIYSAKQAVDNGLVDRIGFLDAAVARAIELARLDQQDVTVVEYKREPNLGDILLGSSARSRSFDLATLLDMTAPRVYYLCTWLPPLAESR